MSTDRSNTHLESGAQTAKAEKIRHMENYRQPQERYAKVDNDSSGPQKKGQKAKVIFFDSRRIRHIERMIDLFQVLFSR